MDINMVFMIPTEFHVPTEDVTELALGAERAMFEKPKIQVRTSSLSSSRGTWMECRSDTCSLMEVQASISCHCHC
jgi:hypothetical protein